MYTLCKSLSMLGIQCPTDSSNIDAVRANYVEHLNQFGISYATNEEFEFRF